MKWTISSIIQINCRDNKVPNNNKLKCHLRVNTKTKA